MEILNKLKYWIGAFAFIGVYIFILTGSFWNILAPSNLEIPKNTFIIIVLGLLWLTSYILAVEVSVAFNGIGSYGAHSGASDMMSYSNKLYSNAKDERERAKIKEMRYRIKMLKEQGRENLIPEILERFGYSRDEVERNFKIINTSAIENNIGYNISNILYQFNVHLALILCTILPIILKILGFIFHTSLIGNLIFNYSSSILSIIYGIIAIIYFNNTEYRNLVIITLIGLIAYIIVTIVPPFSSFISVTSLLLCSQLGICGILSEFSSDYS